MRFSLLSAFLFTAAASSLNDTMLVLGQNSTIKNGGGISSSAAGPLDLFLSYPLEIYLGASNTPSSLEQIPYAQ